MDHLYFDGYVHHATAYSPVMWKMKVSA